MKQYIESMRRKRRRPTPPAPPPPPPPPPAADQSTLLQVELLRKQLEESRMQICVLQNDFDAVLLQNASLHNQVDELRAKLRMADAMSRTRGRVHNQVNRVNQSLSDLSSDARRSSSAPKTPTEASLAPQSDASTSSTSYLILADRKPTASLKSSKFVWPLLKF